MTIEPEEERAIGEVVERLAQQFPQAPAEAVSSLVDEAHHEFDQSPIRAFVPVLVERQVRARLGTAR